MTEKSQVLHSESETEDLASDLSIKIKALFLEQDLLSLRIALIGDLGVGKTTFTRYLLKSLGHMGKVKSPTYTLCEPYEIALSLTSEPDKFSQQKLHIHHFDLYRMNQANEWIDAGFREILTNPGICIVEWPEKAEGTLPPFDLTIHLETNDEQTRFVKLISHTKFGQNLIS